MKRLSLALIIAIITSAAGISPAFAQPVMNSGPAADELILRVISDDNWTESTNEFGMVATFEEYQLIDGEPQFELFPSALALYQKYGAEDVYYYVHLFNEMPLKDEPVSTAVETRVLVFPDEASASGYLSEAYQAQVDSETAGEAENAQFGPIDPMPAFDNPAVGWTFLENYYDMESREVRGPASTARYLAQVGNVIVSASASGPYIDFNFDLAAGLLNHQVECVVQAAPCEPATITELTSPAWTMERGELMYTGADGTTTPARFMYPVDEPVRAPEVSSIFATPVARFEPAVRQRSSW